jgi:phosphoenolpyruvate carboxylase
LPIGPSAWPAISGELIRAPLLGPFKELIGSSPRFRRTIDFAQHALLHSDVDVLHAVIAFLDPKNWLDRGRHAPNPKQRAAMIAISTALGRVNGIPDF